MNTLTIRNNSQMLLIVASDGRFETSDMESFALEFDGMLLTYVAKSTPTEVHNNEYSGQYNYHPAMSSDTIRHPLWKV